MFFIAVFAVPCRQTPSRQVLSCASVLSLQATLNAVPFYRQHGFMRQERSTVRRGGRDLAVLDMIKTLS